MALIQIEESELLQRQGVVDVLNKMLGNPEARKLVLQARKITEPGVSIPEIDAAAPLNGALNEIRKELQADRAARQKERDEADQQRRLDEFNAGLDRQRTMLRQQGWTEEGLTEVLKHAQERGIPDLEVAAAHYEKLHPPSEPVSPNGASGSWGFFEESAAEDTFVKDMIASQGNNEAALDKEIRLALADVRGQGRR